ncbi:SsgA family sporulation/cell division regulator [Streptomyces sp. NPDC087908]|uniref:SsgA family sporulation/cell division regulator n=1 Tax=Streptomyces sp. NPDC087908 TaxID=3365820 RepID=UPI00381C1B16
MTDSHDTALVLDTVLQHLTPDGSRSVPTRFIYRPTDPFAVTVHFLAEGMVVTWLFARQLIEDGLSGCAGKGDVAIWSGSGATAYSLFFTLHSTNLSVTLEAPRDVLFEWLQDTYRLLPAGAESSVVDWEGISRQFFL